MTPVGRSRFHLTSLGCAKNTVDSQSMTQLLRRAGFQPAEQPKQADLLIVNTCGFIDLAREESYDVLRQLAHEKLPGQILIAAGCLTQRYGTDIARQVSGIDGILGTQRWMDIVLLLQAMKKERQPEQPFQLPVVPAPIPLPNDVPCSAVQGASAYLKIADGCQHPCAFCAIPVIKGRPRSRPIDAILEEARSLQAQGVQELVLIAQDTTGYGRDLGMGDGLTTLLQQLVSAVPDVAWIRLLYAYPGEISDRLIETMALHPRILPYVDMPLQHAHPATLRRMRRPANMEWVRTTIGKLRAAMPELALRTTFIVGYPQESNQEFETLLEFIAEIQFDRVGVFTFSFEHGTPSEPLGDPVPVEVKEQRRARLMELQQGISWARNKHFVGRRLTVLVEGHGDGLSLGRSYRDAPEIDGLVLVRDDVAIGEMVEVLIDEALPYDLAGRVASAESARVKRKRA